MSLFFCEQFDASYLQTTENQESDAVVNRQSRDVDDDEALKKILIPLTKGWIPLNNYCTLLYYKS